MFSGPRKARHRVLCAGTLDQLGGSLVFSYPTAMTEQLLGVVVAQKQLNHCW
jgi:hypothetical protein